MFVSIANYKRSKVIFQDFGILQTSHIGIEPDTELDVINALPLSTTIFGVEVSTDINYAQFRTISTDSIGILPATDLFFIANEAVLKISDIGIASLTHMYFIEATPMQATPINIEGVT